MAVALDSGISGIATSGTTVTATSVIVSAADTRLITFVALELAAGPPPTTVLHNSVGMTLLGSHTDTLGGGIYNISAWYLNNPSVGTFNTVASWTGSATGAGIVSVPITGSDLTRAPVIGTGTDGNSTSAACSVSGAAAGDMQLAAFIASNGATSVTEAGTGQSVITAAPTLPRLNINAACTFSASQIAGSNAGNFVWTIPVAVWSAIGLKIFAAGGAPMTGALTGGLTHTLTQLVTGVPV
jgi:hypothetical protein